MSGTVDGSQSGTVVVTLSGELDAHDAPAGEMTVVLAAGDSGILLHEAVGHGLEADFNRKETSNYSGQIGKPVASPLLRRLGLVGDDAADKKPVRGLEYVRERVKDYHNHTDYADKKGKKFKVGDLEIEDEAA